MAAMPLLGRAQTNLIPNPGFQGQNPLQSWRVAFPYEGWYAANANYVHAAVHGGKSCAEIDLPPGIAGNQGGKVESAFIKAVPGATYTVTIDCMTGNFSAKLHAEAWVTDQHPIDKPDKFRVPAAAAGPGDPGHPALVMCYRAQLPDPPAHSWKWNTVTRQFTVPETVTVGGEEVKPEFLSLKAVVYEGTMEPGKSFFTNFRLSRANGQ
jgi:hypothetical protein